jgi:hypothetical protein
MAGNQRNEPTSMNTLYALLGAFAVAASLHAQAPRAATPAAPAAAVPAPVKEIVLTATAVNVKESGIPVSIRLFRWSTDQERTPLIAAFSAPAPASGRQGGAGRAGAPGPAGQAQRGRAQGQPAPGQDQDDPTQEQEQDDAARGRGQDQAAQGRGQGQAGQGQTGGARGGRGGQAPLTAVSPFTQALQKAPTIGYLWTNEPTGYSVKYASRTTQPDGSDRIVVITEPRLGAYSPAWTLKTGTATDYAFTLIEVRLNAKGGEGKSSLGAEVVADASTKQLVLEDYAAALTLLANAKLTTK